MLSENQVRRLLKQCEKGMEEDKGLDDLDIIEIKGWCQALRLVLEENTYPIKDKPLEDEWIKMMKLVLSKRLKKLKEKEFKERLLILSDLNIGVIENEYTW